MLCVLCVCVCCVLCVVLCEVSTKNIGVFGCCDCGGKAILNVEAVSPRWVVDRRVLTADVDAGLGLITCLKRGVGQIAKQHPCWRSGAGGSPDSSQQQ